MGLFIYITGSFVAAFMGMLLARAARMLTVGILFLLICATLASWMGLAFIGIIALISYGDVVLWKKGEKDADE